MNAIYADEDVDIAVIEGLRRREYEAYSPHDFDNLGLADDEQISFARSQKYVLLTHDQDFLMKAVPLTMQVSFLQTGRNIRWER